jgi:hypothetical protein
MRGTLLVLALLLAACARPAPVGPTSAAPFDPATLVPEGAVAVGWLDAAALLGRPALKEEGALVQQLNEKFRGELGIDPALLVGAALFYAPVPGETIPQRGAAVIPGVLRGSPGLAELGSSAEHEGRTLYRLGQTQAAVSFLDRATVVGDELSVRATLDVAAGKRRVLAAGDDLWKLLGALRNLPFRIALRLAGLGGLLARLPIPAELKAVQALGVGMDVDARGIRAELTALAANPEALAESLRAALGKLAQDLQRSSFLRALGEIVGGVEVRATGARVALALHVPMALARSMLPTLLGAWSLRPAR